VGIRGGDVAARYSHPGWPRHRFDSRPPYRYHIVAIGPHRVELRVPPGVPSRGPARWRGTYQVGGGRLVLRDDGGRPFLDLRRP